MKKKRATGSTGRIRIIKTPEGEAPFWVREIWVGTVLPCTPYVGYAEKMPYEVVSGRKVAANYRGFSVPQERALKILKKISPAAADWWKAHGFPKPAPENFFLFADHEARIIRGVTPQILIEVTDEMQGDPNR